MEGFLSQSNYLGDSEVLGQTQMHPAKGRGSGEEGITLTARDRAEQRVLEEEQPLHC